MPDGALVQLSLSTHHITGMLALPMAGMVSSAKPSLGANADFGCVPASTFGVYCWNCCWIAPASELAALSASTFVHHSV